jgi:hypothetical protein
MGESVVSATGEDSGILPGLTARPSLKRRVKRNRMTSKAGGEGSQLEM